MEGGWNQRRAFFVHGLGQSFSATKENRLCQPVVFLPTHILYLITTYLVLVFVNTVHRHTGKYLQLKCVCTNQTRILFYYQSNVLLAIFNNIETKWIQLHVRI